MKKQFPLFLCLLLMLALFSACNKDPTGQVFRMDIVDPVENLDPQFTTAPHARMILGNLYEGLVTLAPDGEIRPGVAESYDISPDGLSYTFTLRKDAVWSSQAPVTSSDFLFTFSRLFTSNSPYARLFSALANSGAVLAGESPFSTLGVAAPDPHTLTLTLDRPDPFLLERLADPAAAPCNQAFFDGAKGRYGLEIDFLCTNGPFFLERWDNTKYITIRAFSQYRSQNPTLAGGVNFYIGKDVAKQFADGVTDVALLNFEQQEKSKSDPDFISPVQKTVWCLVFNQNHSLWGNPLLRQGLARTIDHAWIGENIPTGFETSNLLIPNAYHIQGVPYRQYGPQESPLAFNTKKGAHLFGTGLDSLGLDQLPKRTSINFPELAAQSLNMGMLQQSWQMHLSAFINFEVASPTQIQDKFRTGDYQILLMPFTAASGDVRTLLEAFTSDSPQNYFGYQNILYDNLLASAAEQPTPQLAAEKYALAETQILSDAVVIPLFFETTYLNMAEDVSGIEVSPYADRVYFKYALKE